MNYYICTKVLENVKDLEKYCSLADISYNIPAKKVTENDHIYSEFSLIYA